MASIKSAFCAYQGARHIYTASYAKTKKWFDRRTNKRIGRRLNSACFVNMEGDNMTFHLCNWEGRGVVQGPMFLTLSPDDVVTLLRDDLSTTELHVLSDLAGIIAYSHSRPQIKYRCHAAR